MPVYTDPDELIRIELLIPQGTAPEVYCAVAAIVRRHENPNSPGLQEHPPIIPIPRSLEQQVAIAYKGTGLGTRPDLFPRFMDILVETPGQWHQWRDICRALDSNVHQMSGVLAAVNKRLKYRGIQVPYLRRDDGGGSIGLRYCVSPQVAQIVHTLRTSND